MQSALNLISLSFSQ